MLIALATRAAAAAPSDLAASPGGSEPGEIEDDLEDILDEPDAVVPDQGDGEATDELLDEALDREELVPLDDDDDIDSDLLVIAGVPDLTTPGLAQDLRTRRGRLGHIELALGWRRADYAPASGSAGHVAHELWLYGTWRQ